MLLFSFVVLFCLVFLQHFSFNHIFQNLSEPNSPIPNFQNGRTSLCHPWSSGVTTWMTQNFLGVAPDVPGFKRWTARPMLYQVQGTVPTPQGGIIRLDVDVVAGVHRVQVPKDTVGRLCVLVPPERREQFGTTTMPTALLNGEPYTLNIEHDTVRRLIFACTSELSASPLSYTLTMPVLTSTTTTTTTTSSTTTTTIKPQFSGNPFPPPSYAAVLHGEDRTTLGNWPGVYGRDGYIIFAPTGSSSTISSLPSYINNWVTENNAYSTFAGPFDNDPRGLIMPSSGMNTFDNVKNNNNNNNNQNTTKKSTYNPKRALGAININLEGYFDIFFKTSQRTLISLYFCDFDHQPGSEGSTWFNRFSVLFYDIRTRNTVAPLTVIDNFQGGVWLTVEYTDSLRLRFSAIVSSRPMLSAIMFDSVQ